MVRSSRVWLLGLACLALVGLFGGCATFLQKAVRDAAGTVNRRVETVEGITTETVTVTGKLRKNAGTPEVREAWRIALQNSAIRDALGGLPDLRGSAHHTLVMIGTIRRVDFTYDLKGARARGQLFGAAETTRGKTVFSEIVVALPDGRRFDLTPDRRRK